MPSYRWRLRRESHLAVPGTRCVGSKRCQHVGPERPCARASRTCSRVDKRRAAAFGPSSFRAGVDCAAGNAPCRCAALPTIEGRHAGSNGGPLVQPMVEDCGCVGGLIPEWVSVPARTGSQDSRPSCELTRRPGPGGTDCRKAGCIESGQAITARISTPTWGHFRCHRHPEPPMCRCPGSHDTMPGGPTPGRQRTGSCRWGRC